MSNDLDRAAKEYAYGIAQSDERKTYCKEDFIAGAEWRKQQIIKDSVSGEVRHCIRYWISTDEDELQNYLKKFVGGDKVKVIIVKEE